MIGTQGSRIGKRADNEENEKKEEVKKKDKKERKKANKSTISTDGGVYLAAQSATIEVNNGSEDDSDDVKWESLDTSSVINL